LFQAEAILRSEKGEPELACAAIENGLKAAGSLKAEPILISQMVRLGCYEIVGKSVERLVTRRVLSREQLHRLSQAFADAESFDPEAFTRALAGERCFGIHVFQMTPTQLANVLQFDMTGPGEQASVALYFASGLRNWDFVFYLDAMERWVALSREPGVDGLRTVRQAQNDFEKEMEARRFGLISRQLQPALGSLIEKQAQSQARLRSVRTALAVEQCRLANEGRIPERLEELIPAYLTTIPLDPFDGGTLKYRRLEPGYVIYSVGRDRQDDGGREPSLKRRGNQTSDVTFTIER
jgi:hypothetical protein